MTPDQVKELVAAVKILAQEKNLSEDQVHQIVETAPMLLRLRRRRPGCCFA